MPTTERDDERDDPDALTTIQLLRQAGLLAKRDPGTVAAAPASYRERLGLDHVGLAVWLGVNPTQLAALGLCARPVPTSPAFVDVVGGSPGGTAPIRGGRPRRGVTP